MVPPVDVEHRPQHPGVAAVEGHIPALRSVQHDALHRYGHPWYEQNFEPRFTEVKGEEGVTSRSLNILTSHSATFHYQAMHVHIPEPVTGVDSLSTCSVVPLEADPTQSLFRDCTVMQCLQYGSVILWTWQWHCLCTLVPETTVSICTKASVLRVVSNWYPSCPSDGT